MANGTATIQQRAQTGGARPAVNYPPIILWEFIGCTALTVLTPVATQEAKQGLSPWGGAELVKLAAIVVVYFLLAAVSAAGPGAARVAAWLGGLLLIADGLYEASNLSKDFALFTGGLNKAATSGKNQA